VNVISLHNETTISVATQMIPTKTLATPFVAISVIISYEHFQKVILMNTSTILRQISMLKLIPKSPSFVLTKHLYENLSAEGFGASKRTIERDLNKLKDLMGLKSVESPEGNKWSYDINNTELLPNMLPSEALLLSVAHQQLSHSLPESSISKLEPRFDKAKQVLNQMNKFRNWEDKINVLPNGYPLIRKPMNEPIREKIYDAVLNKNHITLIYEKRRGQPISEYSLNPHGLIVRDYIHYLVATKEESPDKFQLFKLSKMKKITESIKKFQSTQSDLAVYFKSNASGFILVDTPQKIELIVGGPLLSLLIENKLSEDQTFDWVDDTMKWANISATVYISFDLIHLLTGYGKWAKVKGPKILIDEMEKQFN